MEIKKTEVISQVRTLGMVAKFPGGEDLIHFSPGKMSVRSHIVDVDVVIPGWDYTITGSAKALLNILKDLGEDIQVKELKSGLKFSDGVRSGILKKQDIADIRQLSMDYDEMSPLPNEFFSCLRRSSFDGKGNRGIQFLGDYAVNRTLTEVRLFKGIPLDFYLQEDQIPVILELISDGHHQVTDTTIRFTDLTHSIECRRGHVPQGMTTEIIAEFLARIEKSPTVLIETLVDGVLVALKHVSGFSSEEEETGKSIELIFDSEEKSVKLAGDTVSGYFSEIVDMPYEGTDTIKIRVPVPVLQALVGHTFSILQRTEEGLNNHVWFYSAMDDWIFVGQGEKQ